jgi:hypothetical protein
VKGTTRISLAQNRRGVAFHVLARTPVDARNRLQRLRVDRRDALGQRVATALETS